MAYKFLAHDVIRFEQILFLRGNAVEKQFRARNVAKEFGSESPSLGGTCNKPGDVRENKKAKKYHGLFHSRKRITSNLCMRRRQFVKERGLPRVRKTDKSGISDEP